MAERAIDKIYTALRAQALSFGSVEIRATPVVSGGRALGVVMDMGEDAGVATIVGLADGTTSMYVSNGGGMLGIGENPDAAAASKRWVAVAEAALPALAERDDDDLPEDGSVRLTVLTTGRRFTATAAESELRAGAHPLSALYAAGQQVITEIRAVDDSRQHDD